jgi:hypothetical protein
LIAASTHSDGHWCASLVLKPNTSYITVIVSVVLLVRIIWLICALFVDLTDEAIHDLHGLSSHVINSFPDFRNLLHLLGNIDMVAFLLCRLVLCR